MDNADANAPAQSPLHHRSVVVGVVCFVLLAVVFVLFAANAPRSAASIDGPGYSTPPPIAKSAEVVYLGIEPIQVDSISLDDNTFQTSFYIWWRWHGKIDPCPTTDIVNSNSSTSHYITNYSFFNRTGVETPLPIGGGWLYQTAKVSVGVTDPFSISRYPLDDQVLAIRVENNTYDSNELVYIPDTANMSKQSTFDVAGWSLEGTSIRGFLHQYGTNFGVPDKTGASTRYSELTYDIDIVRPFSHFLVKLFVPMFVVLLAGLSSLLVKADDFDVRLAMAGTGLLTLIFLQQGYAGDLPATAPVVLMDEIYALAYAAVGITFLRAVYTTTRVHHARETAALFAPTDRRLAAAIALAFLVGSTIVVAL